MIVQGMEVKGVIKVSNARIYGMEESLLAATYPKALQPIDMDQLAIDGGILKTKPGAANMHDYEIAEPYARIAKYLGKAKPGSGHDCYLKGIQVQFDLQVPEYIWRQIDRYHFIDYISSQSKMHKILELDVNDICNKYVKKSSIESLNESIAMYNEYEEGKFDTVKLRDGSMVPYTKEELFNIIIANTPSGISLTARMTTNYLQLKSMIGQRQNHKMQEWVFLCDWFKSLPLVDTIILKDNIKGEY